jgi:tetratricopeptide (TPR) repeat protein
MFTRRHRACAPLVFAVWALCGLSLGQAAASASSTVEDKARAAYTHGAALYQSHRFAEAAKAFAEGYKAKPHPAFLWNEALAYHALGDHARAIDAYKSYLQVCPTSATADRAAAEQALADEQQRLAAASAPPAPAPVAAAVAAGAAPAPALTHATDAATGGQSTEGSKIYRKWWFWTATGAAVAALAIGLGVGLAPGSTAPYREVSWR